MRRFWNGLFASAAASMMVPSAQSASLPFIPCAERVHIISTESLHFVLHDEGKPDVSIDVYALTRLYLPSNLFCVKYMLDSSEHVTMSRDVLCYDTQTGRAVDRPMTVYDMHGRNQTFALRDSQDIQNMVIKIEKTCGIRNIRPKSGYATVPLPPPRPGNL